MDKNQPTLQEMLSAAPAAPASDITTPTPGQIFKDTAGGFHVIVTTAYSGAARTVMVIHQLNATGEVWATPLAYWNTPITRPDGSQVPRYTKFTS